MLSPPHEKATLPTYSESQAFAGLSSVHHPTDLDNPQYGEDNRPLPPGWIRRWDSGTENYFYVDTTANPPRSVWEHPDDLVEEQEPVPIASSHSIRREKVEAGIPFEDSPRTIPLNQHTPLLGQSGL
ncbi:hypothetical protein FRC05_007959 [Tulasnella sp. 425]|nr:hypothetical protein FRC05_007959 [Tulasnella sp. 425]